MDSTAADKLPYKRLEVAVNKCVRVAVPLHLEMLQKHKINIEKFTELEEWGKLNREQINASRTVEQLKADIWALNSLRNRVLEDDVGIFDRNVDPVKRTVEDTVAECTDSMIPAHLTQNYQNITLDDVDAGGATDDENGQIQNTQRQQQRQLLMRSDGNDEAELLQWERELLENAKAVASSWNKLNQDLRDLSETMETCSSLVHQQRESVNCIEDNIETAQENIQEGTRQLHMAAKLKMAMLPAVGALAGGCVGGPIGILVGLKAGAVAAVAGGLLGYTGATVIKRKINDRGEAEMQSLKSIDDKKSNSLPDLGVTNM